MNEYKIEGLPPSELMALYSYCNRELNDDYLGIKKISKKHKDELEKGFLLVCHELDKYVIDN